MSTVKEGDPLWTPSAERVERAHLTHYMRWLAQRGHRFNSYTELWQWSIDDQDGFWGSLWEYFDIRTSQPFVRVLAKRTMPGAEWFPGAKLNYAEHALRHERDGADEPDDRARDRRGPGDAAEVELCARGSRQRQAGEEPQRLGDIAPPGLVRAGHRIHRNMATAATPMAAKPPSTKPHCLTSARAAPTSAPRSARIWLLSGAMTKKA